MTGLAQPTVLHFGPEGDNIADLRLPTVEANGCLAIIIHGGDWQLAATRAYLDPMAAGLAGLGYAVASIEYRRLGGGGGWPATFDDVALALESVPPLARAEALMAGFTLDRAVVIGHSAGGQLALWAAAQPLVSALPIVGVVALGPAADLTLGHELRLGDGAVAELLGGAPAAVPEVAARADPARLNPRLPVHLLHVDGDPVVPVALSRSYAAAVNGDVHYRELGGDSHFSFTTPGEMDWAVLVSTLEDCRAGVAR